MNLSFGTYSSEWFTGQTKMKRVSIQSGSLLKKRHTKRRRQNIDDFCVTHMPEQVSTPPNLPWYARAARARSSTSASTRKHSVKTRNCVLKTMDYVLTMTDCRLKLMNCVLK